jgi:hypothetical protein
LWPRLASQGSTRLIVANSFICNGGGDRGFTPVLVAITNVRWLTTAAARMLAMRAEIRSVSRAASPLWRSDQPGLASDQCAQQEANRPGFARARQHVMALTGVGAPASAGAPIGRNLQKVGIAG